MFVMKECAAPAVCVCVRARTSKVMVHLIKELIWATVCCGYFGACVCASNGRDSKEATA